MTDHKCVHLIVSGAVQGVGFRYFVQQQAEALHLTGWVRNRFDDRVEILAQGETDRLQQLLASVKNGPSLSHVTGVEVEWSVPVTNFKRFSIAPTE